MSHRSRRKQPASRRERASGQEKARSHKTVLPKIMEKRLILLGGMVLLLLLSISLFFIFPAKEKTPQDELQIPHATPHATQTSDISIVSNVPSDTQTSKVIRDAIKPLYEQNNDTVGVIRIEDTVIDYPVVYSGDNSYYMDHSFDKKKSKAGSIFLDYRCDIHNLEYNNILYGHHMKDDSMFAELKKYKDRDFFESHSAITFDTLYDTYQWQVFAVYVTDPQFYYINTDFGNDTEWLDFIRACQEKSLYDIEVVLQSDDIVLTLSTCTYEYDDARLVVQARMVK